jgi:hypothetical protein
MAADVVGYSRLMGADEEGTLASLRTLRRELIHPNSTSTRAASLRRREMGCWSRLLALWMP